MAIAAEIGWYPSDLGFRRRFEEAVRNGLRHFSLHGDITAVQRLLDPISDKSIRFLILKSIATQFPVSVGKTGNLVRDRDRANGFDWSAIELAQFWPKRISVRDDVFYLQGLEFSAVELIDEVIDALVLQRHAIPDEHLQRLKEAVDAVARRRAPKAPTNDPDSEGAVE